MEEKILFGEPVKEMIRIIAMSREYFKFLCKMLDELYTN